MAFNESAISALITSAFSVIGVLIREILNFMTEYFIEIAITLGIIALITNFFDDIMKMVRKVFGNVKMK